MITYTNFFKGLYLLIYLLILFNTLNDVSVCRRPSRLLYHRAIFYRQGQRTPERRGERKAASVYRVYKRAFLSNAHAAEKYTCMYVFVYVSGDQTHQHYDGGDKRKKRIKKKNEIIMKTKK